MTQRTHWDGWHDAYDDPTSGLSRRLELVRRRIAEALDGMPPGPVVVVSMCAGQGRDVLDVLRWHPRAGDVRARLVELDPANAAVAAATLDRLGLSAVEVVEGDAALTDAYVGAVPADLVVACGIFGNVSDDDVERTVRHLPMLCAPGATVLWTRHRMEPDLTPSIRGWFTDAGFEELAFDPVPGAVQSVGTARLAVPPPPFEPGVRLFAFVR